MRRNITVSKILKEIDWTTLVVILIFGPVATGNMAFPPTLLNRIINIADFIQNFDFILVQIWIIIVFTSLSLNFFIVVKSTAQLFSLMDHKPLTFSLTTLLIGYSLQLANNSEEIIDFILHDWVPISLIIGSIPLVYLVVYWIRFRYRKQRSSI